MISHGITSGIGARPAGIADAIDVSSSGNHQKRITKAKEGESAVKKGEQKMAVAIARKDGLRASITTSAQKEAVREEGAPSPSPGRQEGADTAEPSVADASDPESAVLMRILEKMLLKHTLTGKLDKGEYTKFRPR